MGASSEWEPSDFRHDFDGTVFAIGTKRTSALSLFSLQDRCLLSGVKRTSQIEAAMSAFGGKADIPPHYRHVRF